MADTIAADRAAAQLGEQVDPEFVFDEDGDWGGAMSRKRRAFARCVDRQVEDDSRPDRNFCGFRSPEGEKET